MVPVLTRGFGFSIPPFMVFMPIWMSRLWLDRIMMFRFVLSLKSLIAPISQSSVSLALVAPNRGCRTPLLVPMHGTALYVREGFCSFWQSKLECSFHESCLFCIYSRINNFYVNAINRNPGHDISLYDCLLDSMAEVQSVDDKAVFVFVGYAKAFHSEWLESVSPTDRHGRDALDFCSLSGCEQLIRCPSHISGNRLNLVMVDVPDILDVFFSIHCQLSLLCQLCGSG